MQRNSGMLGATAICTFLVLALTWGSAQARVTARDAVYEASGLEGRQFGSVAILPFVAVADNPDVERAAELAWLTFYGEARTKWMPSVQVNAFLAEFPGEGPRLVAVAEQQIWRSGEIAPETAARLAQLLGVDAVLGVRIDEWEIVDGGIGAVAMTATIHGADGPRLWGISGLASLGHGRRSWEGNFDWGLERIWNARLEPQETDHRLEAALCKLLIRWAPSMPDAIFEEWSVPARLAFVEEQLSE